MLSIVMVTWSYNKIVKEENSWDWERVQPSVVTMTLNKIVRNEDSWDRDRVSCPS